MRLSRHLQKGDAVAIVSPSWGGPAAFPHIYDNGLKVLRNWGLDIREFPSARAEDSFLSANPEFRAKDINDAFADPSIRAIFASIGGDDSMRILPYLDRDLIAANPKILMGYSDTTTLHVYLNLLGSIGFHGPAIMAGFSQMESLPGYADHVHEMLFKPSAHYNFVPLIEYANEYPDWMIAGNVGKVSQFKKAEGWRTVQGHGVAEGQLFGGCIEVLEFLKGTAYWPEPGFWNDKILFFETSEDKPPISNISWMLRNYGLQGVFDRVSAIMFGRARDYNDDEKLELEKMIGHVIGQEFRRPDLIVMANMDFGHTEPQMVLPLGATAQLDADRHSFSLTGPWLV